MEVSLLEQARTFLGALGLGVALGYKGQDYIKSLLEGGGQG